MDSKSIADVASRTFIEQKWFVDLHDIEVDAGPFRLDVASHSQ
jgi:hypothetical protein